MEARPRGGRGGAGAPVRGSATPLSPAARPAGPLAHPRRRPGPRVTQWDRGEARPPSLCGSRVYGKYSSSFRSLSSSPEVPPDAPTPPPAAATTTRKNEELVAGCVCG